GKVQRPSLFLITVKAAELYLVFNKLAPSKRGALATFKLVEGVTTSTGATGIRVVDGKALLFDGVCKINLCAHQVRNTHLVNDQVNPLDGVNFVAIQGAVIKVKLVAQASAAAWLYRDAQGEVIATFLVKQRLCLGSSSLGQNNTSCRCWSSHVSPLTSMRVSNYVIYRL